MKSVVRHNSGGDNKRKQEQSGGTFGSGGENMFLVDSQHMHKLTIGHKCLTRLIRKRMLVSDGMLFVWLQFKTMERNIFIIDVLTLRLLSAGSPDINLL